MVRSLTAGEIEQPVDIRQEHEQIGAHEAGHEPRQQIVVANTNLIHRDRVVLVDDRHHTTGQEPVQRVPRVEVTVARGKISVRQQHLAHRQIMFGEQLAVQTDQASLPRRRRRLQ